MKAPTNSETKPNTSRKVLRNPRLSVISCDCDRASCGTGADRELRVRELGASASRELLGRHARPGGRLDRVEAALAEHPQGLGPRSARRPSRRRTSRRRRAGSGRRSGSPYAARRPARRSRHRPRSPPSSRSRGRSRPRPPSAGSAPGRPSNASKRGYSATDATKFGAPPTPMRLPSLPSTVAGVEDRALRRAPRPGSSGPSRAPTARPSARSPPSLVVSMNFFGVIAASVPLLVWAKMLSKLRVDRVGEDVRRRDQRDAEHDREQRERQPRACGRRARGARTRRTAQVPRVFIRSKTSSAVAGLAVVDDAPVLQHQQPVGDRGGAGRRG